MRLPEILFSFAEAFQYDWVASVLVQLPRGEMPYSVALSSLSLPSLPHLGHPTSSFRPSGTERQAPSASLLLICSSPPRFPARLPSIPNCNCDIPGGEKQYSGHFVILFLMFRLPWELPNTFKHTVLYFGAVLCLANSSQQERCSAEFLPSWTHKYPSGSLRPEVSGSL